MSRSEILRADTKLLSPCFVQYSCSGNSPLKDGSIETSSWAQLRPTSILWTDKAQSSMRDIPFHESALVNVNLPAVAPGEARLP